MSPGSEDKPRKRAPGGGRKRLDPTREVRQKFSISLPPELDERMKLVPKGLRSGLIERALRLHDAYIGGEPFRLSYVPSGDNVLELMAVHGISTREAVFILGGQY